MKKIFFALLLTICVLNLNAQKYFTKTGNIQFLSKTPLEDITAENRKVVSVLDVATGALEFSLLMKGFDFPNQLMEDHFNESYAESSLFPKATFKGKIVDLSKIDFKKDGTYTADVLGNLTIKDVTKEIKTSVTFVIKNGTIVATSKIDIKPREFNFKIPATAENKIAQSVAVNIKMDYALK
ncbi:MAG: YceI family protein [Bacteroidota bacterium]|nr:YceI family protein [Bacteroidota bacterium]